jgi:hypothetical protein
MRVNQRCFKLVMGFSLVELLRGAFNQPGASSAIVAAIGVSSIPMSKSSLISQDGNCASNSEFQVETAGAGRNVSDDGIASFAKVASVEARDPFSPDFESDEAEVPIA